MVESYYVQVDDDVYFFPGEPSKYVNHSCAPNAGLCLHDGSSAVHLKALRDIAVNEQITFDYSTCMEGETWTLACLCDAPHCRGVITNFHTLPAALKLSYKESGVLLPFLLSQC